MPSKPTASHPGLTSCRDRGSIDIQLAVLLNESTDAYYFVYRGVQKIGIQGDEKSPDSRAKIVTRREKSCLFHSQRSFDMGMQHWSEIIIKG
jgi:hypothetical protein